jgi:hypothetical protein
MACPCVGIQRQPIELLARITITDDLEALRGGLRQSGSDHHEHRKKVKQRRTYQLGERWPVLAYTFSGGKPLGGTSLTLIFRHVPLRFTSLGL